MEKLRVIKIGGNIIDNEAELKNFLTLLAKVEGAKVLIHGGGKLATHLAEQLHIPQHLKEGRRITDAETLKVVTMLYAGHINKNIVAILQSNQCNALGLCGADGNLISAKKRIINQTDYGFVGDVETVNADLLNALLHQQIVPVIAPITHNGQGQLLNTNADTIAQEIAKALSKHYQVELVYSFEKAGVLENADDDQTLIPVINPTNYALLKTTHKIFSGMIPKLDNAFEALHSGVFKVLIGKAEQLPALLAGTAGTSIVL